MNILVTGATGFLGTALCSRLEAEGHKLMRLSSKNCDLTRFENLNRYNDLDYDQIYHLAAWTQAGDFCLHHPGEQWVINQQMNTNVLAWWQQKQPQATLIAMGTSCAYDPSLGLTEENYLAGRPVNDLLSYAMTKRMLYIGLKALQKQYGLNYLYLIPSTLYGPGYHQDERQLHFIFDLIKKILRGKLYGEPVVLWGDGHQRRELFWIHDFVDVMLKLAPGRSNEIVNVGAGEEFEIRHFAHLICEEVGYNFDKIRFDTDRFRGVASKCLVTSKLKRLFPDLKLTPLAMGLPQVIEWCRVHLT